MEPMDPVGLDGDGFLHFDGGDDDEEDTLQVKSRAGEEEYSYQIYGHTFVFNHLASAKELCQVMLECEDIVAKIKKLRPWGEEELLAIEFTRINMFTEDEERGAIIIFYQGDGSE